MLKFNISASCFIFSFLIWLLVGRESLENGKIENDKIGDDEDGVGIADCEKFLLNYTDRRAVSLYSANSIINKITTETANTY
jgi:hypothetical protein